MWKLSITTTLEAEDAVAELLGNVFAQIATVHTDFATNRTTVAIYCDARPAGLSAKMSKLRDGLARIKRCGLNVGSARIRAAHFRREDWAESWKRHFKPIEVGDALLIKPSWSERRPRKRQAVVVLDPGLSFGTGHHPTTKFCLCELTRRRDRRRPQEFLDLGTGSGILGIAAAKLGYSPVEAIEYDPESVRVARVNARVNRVPHKLRITRQDLTKLSLRPTQRYDLICANLISTLLMAERKRIVRRLKPGGRLVVAGILKSEFNSVAQAFKTAGLRLVASKVEKEWRSGAFVAVH
ncbi:MAG: 50S ribosomal protein L11 methyltransferase [Verrucomicrobiota bacterium]